MDPGLFSGLGRGLGSGFAFNLRLGPKFGSVSLFRFGSGSESFSKCQILSDVRMTPGVYIDLFFHLWKTFSIYFCDIYDGKKREFDIRWKGKIGSG